MTTSLEEGPLREAAILTKAVENVFRKLIRLLIGRMSLVKLQEMIRIIFVEEAEDHINKDQPGKKISMTKLALLTGMDTRTINRYRRDSSESVPIHRERKFLREITPECSVLDYWSNNPKYKNVAADVPLDLEIKDGNVSFDSLVRDALSSRGITSNSILTKLLSSKSVEIDEESNQVRLVNAQYWPFEMEGALGAIELGLASVGNLVETIVHNVETMSDQSKLFFQRSNWTNRLNRKDAAKLRSEARKYLSKAETDTINILASLEQDEIEEDQITAGISLFYFEDASSVSG